VTAVPHSPEAEEVVVARLLREPALVGQVVGAGLEGAHFHLAANRVLYDALVEAFYAEDPIDALVIGSLHAKRLAKMWNVEERVAIQRVVRLAQRPSDGSPLDHARLIRRDHDYRRLLKLADEIRDSVISERQQPDEIAGVVSQGARGIAAGSTAAQELVSFGDAGRRFVHDIQVRMSARERGVELGVYFGLKAIDDYVRGLQPTEVLILAGEPGVGKSSVVARGALTFAETQSERAADERVGTLIVSLEMGEVPSNARFASMLGFIAGEDIREAKLSGVSLGRLIENWRERVDVPLWFNYAPTLRASQLRALISEAIRRYNVGLVVIDHFRMWDLDRRLDNKVDEDEEKVRFLKEQIAGALNVAVICLAHTRKPDPASNGRPKMVDLRGSYQVAAHSDIVGFIYRPSMYATHKQLEKGETRDTDAEMIWAKNRQGKLGSMGFYMDASRMVIVD
jgi:replicative DNA helicase